MRRALIANAVLLASILVLVVLAQVSTAQADPAVAASPSPEREATSRIHTRGRYPNDLLVAPADDEVGTGRGRAPIPVFGGRGAPTAPPDPPDDWLPRFGIPDWLSAFLQALGYFGYVVLALAIAALVALIVWLLFKFRRPPPEEAAAEPRSREGASHDVHDPLLVVPDLSHEELARQGRYREAVHALLVAALVSTGFVAEGRARGATAREIVRSYAKSSPPREPLVTLLGIVERVWFGGRTASRSTYEEALDSYSRFVPEARANVTRGRA